MASLRDSAVVKGYPALTCRAFLCRASRLGLTFPCRYSYLAS